MQLDIFEHSHDVILRNAVIDALNCRDTEMSCKAVAALAAEYSSDILLPHMNRLCQHLAAGALPSRLDPESAETILRQMEETLLPAAKSLLGLSAASWLLPFWRELAASMTDIPFDPRGIHPHAAPLWLRSNDWKSAIACINTIPAWHRQPLPLEWMIEAESHLSGAKIIWPLIAEFAWMAPGRTRTLMDRLNLPVTKRLIARFDAEFDGNEDSSENDFAWFPAWCLIAEGDLIECLKSVQRGNDTPPERCTRLLIALLTLERQGCHREIVENRKKLRDVHPALFTLYMRNR
ncbi:MAG: hypothetical protein Q8O19_05565 [Rectinemataceae bacterium]|nr:hypothetical protein [Rectinemataceae bacterium]